MEPPPDYSQSVHYTSVMHEAGQNTGFLQQPPAQAGPSSGGTLQWQPDFEILVLDPVKQGEGTVGAFVAYKVRTRALTERHTKPPTEVVRRFRDFSWLADKLAEKNKGIIIPPLPEKSAVQKFQMQAEFIEVRRRALQVFLNKVAAHPALREAKELFTFLEASEEEWMLEMARWNAESQASKPGAVTGAVQWLRGLQSSAQSLLNSSAAASINALEDAEYLKVRDYIHALEPHLVEAHRQAGKLVRKEAELALALAEFGSAAQQLGKFDEGSAMRGAFDALCARASQIATSSRQRADALSVSFEAPLKEVARTIRSVQAAMADRGTALGNYAQARSDLETKKVRLAKLRGTPGLREDKIAEAERDVQDAESKVRSTKVTYDQIVARMTEELNRFQKERAADVAGLLRNFAVAQAHYAAENAKAWSALLQDIQHPGGSPGMAPPPHTMAASGGL